MLQGIPDTSLAVMAIVAVVVAHCVWMCSAPKRRAIRPIHRPFGKRSRFARQLADAAEIQNEPQPRHTRIGWQSDSIKAAARIFPFSQCAARAIFSIPSPS